MVFSLLPLFLFWGITIMSWDTQWRYWLRHRATGCNVAGSITNGIMGIFH